jgi:digeranylgeranylglycerophospholipid reductase
MSEFDIIIAGAGPAGSMAAISASKAGRKVCLLARKAKAGVPVRCGEGIGRRGLLDHIEPKPEWIRNTIKKAVMVSPSGIRIDLEGASEDFILDREKMDSDLVKEAINAGASYFSETPITSVRKNGEIYECITPEKTFSSRVLILADGVESRLARFLGWNTTLELSDVETCAFARVVSPLIEKNACIFFTGTRVAPGGYAWVFPRAVGEANVGLGISGNNSESGKARQYLERFINSEFPGARISNLHCGGVPVTRYIRPLVKEGAMLVGDAARQVNCLSGAGLAYSLYAGKLAGKTAADAFSENTVNYKHLKLYEKNWNKKFGKQQRRSYSLKKFVEKYGDDAFLDRIAQSLSKEDPAKLNYLKVFSRTFSGHPLLMLKAIKLFR